MRAIADVQREVLIYSSKKLAVFSFLPPDTLLDIKLPEEGNRPLTDSEMVNLCSELLDAGADTTSTGRSFRGSC